MSRRIYEFGCSEGHITERFIDESFRTTECAECGLPAGRVVSPVTSVLDPISGTYPGATMKWARYRQQKIQQERKDNGA